MTVPRPRRPLYFSPSELAAQGGMTDGPEELATAAHAAAAALVAAGREAQGSTETARLVALTDEVGLDTLAQLWSQRPARSLPGALWRLYLLREWARAQSDEASREYALGMHMTQVNHVIAGSADPPTPSAMAELVDEILAGLFTGDFSIALERASSLCRVISAGRAGSEGDANSAASMLTTAEDLHACARMWRAGTLN